MLTRLAALSLISLLLLCVRAGAGPANAEATGVAIIACENFAPYLDGDPLNATAPAELQMACLQAIPATGALSVASAEQALGNGDGRLTYSEVAVLDGYDGNRIDQTCTYTAVVTNATKAAAGCTLLLFAFVDDEQPVTADIPADLSLIESSGSSDFVCVASGSALGQDADCVKPVAGDGDGVVLFHVLNGTAANGDSTQVAVQQEAVEQSATIQLSPASRNDADADGDGVVLPADNCPTLSNAQQINTDDAPIVTVGIGPSDKTVPNGDAFGDACDNDDDNDGFSDFIEVNLRPFDLYHGLCLHAPEDTNPLLADTDGDRVLDRAECILGSDPLDPNAKPPVVLPDTDADGLDDVFENNNGFNPNNADADGDGIGDGVEYKGYNTSPLLADTEGDGCSDGLEIASMDANGAVNSLDLLIVALSFNQTNRPNPDINKNGIVNATDLLIVALNYGAAPCVP